MKHRKKIMIWFAIVLEATLFFSGVYSLDIDKNRFIGCFVNDKFNHEFNSFASHLDTSELTPSLCIEACSAVEYTLAAIEDGSLCFCKSGSVMSERDDENNCTRKSCPGNSNLACGSDYNIMVYESGSNIKINTIALVESLPVDLFSPIHFQVDFVGSPENLYVKDDFETVGTYDLTNQGPNQTNFSYYATKMDQYVEIILSPSTETSSKAANGVLRTVVRQELEKPNMTCPLEAPNTFVSCEISFKTGTNLHMSIDFGDGTTNEKFDLMDFDTINYGTPVPKSLKTTSSFPMNWASRYLIANSLIMEMGILKAIEIYSIQSATHSIILEFGYIYDCGLSISSNQDFSKCVGPTESSIYDCTYLRSSHLCDTANLTSQFENYLQAPMSFTSFFKLQVDLKPGYNIFTNFNDLELKPGSVLVISSDINSGSGPLIDVEETNGLPDYEIISSLKQLSPVKSFKFRVNTIISPQYKKIGLGVFYSKGGNYTITAEISNKLIPGNSFTLNQTVQVYEFVSDVKSSSAGTSCFLNKPCTLTVSSLGTGLNYIWQFNGTSETTRVNTFTHTFTTVGNIFINLTVFNPISNQTINFNIKITDKLEGLSFKSGNAVVSASPVNKPAKFLFILQAGGGYNCNVNYGNSQINFGDAKSDPNNTFFSHIYNNEGVYKVTIDCANEANSLNLSFDHFVQNEITGLELASKGTFVNTEYYIEFNLLTGSDSIESLFYFDNKLENLTLNKMNGKSQLHPGELKTTAHDVYIKLENYVSRVELNTTFEISAPIRNPVFEINPPGDLEIEKYSFPATHKFIISMDSGANVKIDFNTDFYGKQLIDGSNLVVLRTIGDWVLNVNDSNKLSFDYKFSNPGDYLIKLELSNVFGSFVITKKISLVSNIDDLAPSLSNKKTYVLFETSDGVIGQGTADFVFNFLSDSKSGSHALVKFWPGDSKNETHGPFSLSMDYNKNVSTNKLEYVYSQPGDYDVVFEVSNQRGTKTFSLKIKVVLSIFGFYINVEPKYARKDAKVKVSAYMIYGKNVNYEFWVNNQFKQNLSRTAIDYTVDDSISFQATQTGTSIIKVVASDPYFSYTREYSLEVQNPINDFSLTIDKYSQKIDDQDPVSRTIQVTISNVDSKALYVIDFGDGSILNSPKQVGSSATESHTYEKGGIYTVNVTVFNPVSTCLKINKIEIAADFTDFNCKPFWRPYDGSGIIEYEYIKNGSVYYRKSDYDTRFHCTWSRKDAVPTTIQINQEKTTVKTINNITLLEKIETEDRIGFVIILENSLLPSSFKGNISIKIENSVFTKEYDTYFASYSSFRDIEIIKPENVILFNTSEKISVLFSSLGEPSCALIKYQTLNLSPKDIGVFGDSPLCNKLYPTKQFKETYSKNLNIWNFDVSFIQTGNIQLTIEFKNNLETIIAKTNVTIVTSLGDCYLPKLNIPERSKDFLSAAVYKASDLISIVSETQLECQKDIKNIKEWLIYKIDKKTGNVLGQVRLTNNPTINYPELVIQPNTLTYGIYKLTYRVTMMYNNIYTNQIDHYINVIPSPIIIAAFKGQASDGIYEITRGFNQTIIFDPVTYSITPDTRVKISSLSFKYYCRIIQDEIELDYPRLGYNDLIDLKSIKDNFNDTVVDYKGLINDNRSCFKSVDSLSFSSTGNVMVINPRGLEFAKNRVYEVLIKTKHEDYEFKSKIRISILNVEIVPILSLRCKFFETCWSYGDQVKINSNTQLILVGSCDEGCQLENNLMKLSYSYSVYKYWSFTTDDIDIEEKWVPYQNLTLLRNPDTKELTVMSDMFDNNPQIKIWKFELKMTALSEISGIVNAKSSLIVKINEKPKDGSCKINQTSGIVSETVFEISCINWIDVDGSIKKFTFFALYLDDPVKIGLGSSGKEGKLVTTLPLGAIYNSYKLTIQIQIYDNEGAYAIFKLGQEIKVEPKIQNSVVSFQDLINSEMMNDLYSGNTKQMTESILGFSSTVNGLSLMDKKSINAIDNSSTILTTSYGPLSSYDKVPSNSPVDENQFEINRNNRAEMRDFVGSFINNLSISDISSVKIQASMLKELTSQTDEITRNLADTVTNQCIRLAMGLDSMSGKTSVEDIKQSVFGIANTLGNTLTGLSSFLNERGSTLGLDYERANAIPDYYDTDLENFWTIQRNFMGDDGTDTSKDKMSKNMNIQKQKFQVVDNFQKVYRLMKLLTNIVASHFPVGESLQVTTPNLAFKIEKFKAQNLKSNIDIQKAKIKLPSFCELENKKPRLNHKMYNPDDETNCTNKILTLQVNSLSTPASGHNGKNESKIGFSTSIGLSFFDENRTEVSLKDSRKPIDLWIPRDPNAPKDFFEYVNVSNLTIPKNSEILPNSFVITSNNASVHLQIKTIGSVVKVGYLLLMKFGSSPIMNATYYNYDFFEILCPETKEDDSFKFFLNISQVKGYKGFVGYGIRELSVNEVESYCSNSTPREPPFMKPETEIFQHDFKVQVFASGCYYYDLFSGKWRSDGMEILSDTNINSSHCISNHLTDFAGGFIVMPQKINFEYVFANAGFLENPVIYSTVIGLVVIYVLLGLWAFWNDRRDKKKMGITVLDDKYSTNNYYYEVIVFTGNRQNAATDSKVSIIFTGDNSETEPRELVDKKRKLFRRGAIDSFILGCNKPLGHLNYLRIWHDNSGKGNMASWYLKFIIIHDLQSREKFYFLSEKWFALEKSDGLIDRILPVATEKQKTEVRYLIKKQAKQNMRDGHLWFSVFARPVQSTFTRLDRVTCCFVLLAITMMMNILYYGLGTSTNTGGLDIGPFKLTTEQIGIGIITNLFTFPPCFLLIQLFRRSKARSTKSNQIRKIMSDKSKRMERLNSNLMTDIQTVSPQSGQLNETEDHNNIKNKYAVNKKKKLLFPWWTKIIAYMLSFTFAGVSLFFTVVKGIEFGDDKVKKWISSLAISFLSSILLTQPLQVLLIAFFFVIICRKYDENQDNQHDPDDNGESFNDAYTYSKFKHLTDKKIGKLTELNVLREAELETARAERLKEVKVWDAIREIFIYSIFLCVLFSVCYTNNGTQPYVYQNNIKKLFEPSIETIEDFWKWSIDTLSVNLRAGKWYNNSEPFGLAGFINDRTSRLLGYATFRQVRVKNDSCKVNTIFNNYIHHCTEDLSLSNTEDQKFGFNWASYDESFKPEHGMEQMYNSFQFRDTDSLKTYPIIGKYNTYLGGGYVFELRGKKEFIRGNLSLLQQMNWIDRQTRAVLVEFSVFNPGLNLIMVACILVEVLPSGNLLTTTRFDPLNLFNEIKSNSFVLKLVFDAIYMLFIVYFMIKQIRAMIKTGLRSYFKQFWNYIDWLIILFSWFGCGIFLYRLSEAYEVLDFFNKTNGYGYLNLQRINYWNQMLTIFIGLSCSLGTLRFLKLFRFNNRVYSIANTLKYSIQGLFGFSFVFILLWFAFVQVMYLFFYEKLLSYYTIFKSAMTSFQIMLGKFDVSSILSQSPVFGSLIFSFYNIMVVLILVNLFISIVCDAFEKVRLEIEHKQNEIEIIDYFMEKFDSFFGRDRKKNRVRQDREKETYLESHQDLPKKIEKLLGVVSENVEEYDHYMTDINKRN